MSYASAVRQSIDSDTREDLPAAASASESREHHSLAIVEPAGAADATEQALRWFAELSWSEVVPMATVMLTLVVGFLVFAPLLALAG